MSIFITFEGIDGSGKSTQIARLADRLRGLGHEVLLTREPGATETGKAIRELVIHSKHDISPLAELFLYEADRAHHVSSIIQPALAAGTVVISDRFYDSTTAYQGYGRGLDLSLLTQLNLMATGGLKPHKTIWLDGPVDVLLARAKKQTQAEDGGKHDRFESEQLSFFEKLRAGYTQLAANEPERFIKVDAIETPDGVEKIIWQAVEALFTRESTSCQNV